MAWTKLGSTKIATELGTAGNGTNTGVTLDTSEKKLGAGSYSFPGSSSNKVQISSNGLKFMEGKPTFTLAYWCYPTSFASPVCGLVQAILAAYVFPTPGGPVNSIDLARNPDVTPERSPELMAALAKIRTDLITWINVFVAAD